MRTEIRDHHDERAIAFFGSWMIVGLYLDGWAHNVQKPETFFTPWHGVLYSGFVAAVAYFMFRGFIQRKPSSPDRLTTAGLIVFIVAAVGDGIWHQIFGIEVSIEALLSPTHLGLMIGGLLMLGIGYRASVAAGDERADGGVVWTTMLCAAVAMFFTQYYSALRFRGLFTNIGENVDAGHAFIIAAVLFENTILLGLVFVLTRRWRTPRWAFTLAFAALATLQVGLNGFRHGSKLNIVSLAVAGVIVDTLAARLDVRGRVRDARVFSVLVPIAIWGMWLLGLLPQYGIHTPAEIWTGTLILCCLEGAGLGLLAFGSTTPATPPSTPPGAVDHVQSGQLAS